MNFGKAQTGRPLVNFEHGLALDDDIEFLLIFLGVKMNFYSVGNFIYMMNIIG